MSTKPTRREKFALAATVAFLCVPGVHAQAPSSAGSDQTYFEFGTVVSLGQHSVDIHTFDQQFNRTVQHSFLLSKDTRADVVRVGDPVEVIFSWDGAHFQARRLVMLQSGLPQAGPPGSLRPGAAPITRAAGGNEADPVKVVPRAGTVALPTAGTRSAAKAGTVALPAPGASTRTAARAGTVAMPASSTKSNAANNTAANVALGGAQPEKVPGVRSVPMGAADEGMGLAHTASVKTIQQEKPREACQLSNPDWPNQPITIAVLDFRYPTEREESHDTTGTGGGSGTVLGDMVFNRLGEDKEFAYSRADRDRVFRSDFAGAARTGRQLGVDAVIAGTFKPVEPVVDADGFAIAPKTYELSAGLVDTCTGQLLMRMSSVSCNGQPEAGMGGSLAVVDAEAAKACVRYSVTAKQASDPDPNAAAFRKPIDSLLFPLVHGGTPPGQSGTAGTVISVNGAQVSVRLGPGAKIAPGDQLSLLGWHLMKNLATDTLHLLTGEEEGRVTVASVQGGIAVGSFTGDYPARAGDLADKVTQ